MSDPQDMAEDLDDDVSAADAVTADEELLDEDGGLDRDLSDELIDDQLGLVGDDSDPSAEEAALHLVEDS